MTGYHFVVINSGGSHADLSDMYSSIPSDMLNAAKKINHNFLREGTIEEIKLNKTITCNLTWEINKAGITISHSLLLKPLSLFLMIFLFHMVDKIK